MEQLEGAFKQLHLDVPLSTITKFEQYMLQILSKNKEVNLTAITDTREFIKKHFVDSILCADLDEFKNAKNIIDVGTGAGFPGVPLALVFPDKHFFLLDSLGKRVKIVQEIVSGIGISNITLAHGRAEDLAHEKKYRESFDVCVCRAVANLTVLAEYCLPFVSVGGYLIAYKGPDAPREAKESKGGVKRLGGGLACIKKVNLDGFDLDHRIVLIKKIQKTPGNYPRKAGIPAKLPLK